MTFRGTHFILALCMAAFGCSAPETSIIDGSSPEALQASLERINASLPREKQIRFQNAVNTFAGQRSVDIQTLLRVLDGKTVEDVIKEGDHLQSVLDDFDRKQAINEIERLEIAIRESEYLKDQFTKFHILESEHIVDDAPIHFGKTAFDVKVMNGLDQALSRVYFRYALISPGRSIPWTEGEVEYRINGELEPGQIANWRLKPFKFSDQRKIDIPEDTELSLKVERLDGINNKKIFSIRALDQLDDIDFDYVDPVKRIAKLKRTYNID